MIIIQIDTSFIKNAIRWVKFKLNATDSGEAAQVLPFGDDSTPPKNYKGVMTYTSNSSIPIVLGYFNRTNTTNEGEKKIYSLKADGTLGTYVYLKNDGILELGGNTNFAVKFNELKTEYNKLKQSHNNLVNAFNTHMHATAAVGPPVGPTPVPSVIPVTVDSSDIEQAKNIKIKTI